MKFPGQLITNGFFDRDALTVAKAMLGLVLFHRVPHPQAREKSIWLAARIIETEAYFLEERASHASLGFTEKRSALFMPPGTIYMYYARGGDSLNVSCRGEGNAVLVKSGVPWLQAPHPEEMLAAMSWLNPLPGGRPRAWDKLCSGQTLLCRALGLRVPDWDQRQFDPDRLALVDVAQPPARIIQTTRLGIPQGRDGHLPYRFVDHDQARLCTHNPLSRRKGPPPPMEFHPPLDHHSG